MADSLREGLVINEILVDPDGSTYNFDTDNSGAVEATDEFVELYNASNVDIDISGMQLWDAGVGMWFEFPPGTILKPGAHATVMTGTPATTPGGTTDDLFFGMGRNTALINNGGDNVTLYDPVDDEFIQATFNGDSLDDPTLGAGAYSGFSSTATRVGSGENFGFDTDGQSLQRTSDGSDTITSDTPTPSDTNVCFANGTRILTPEGYRRVEDLKRGDLVTTLDHGDQPVLWVFGRRRARQDMARAPKLAPLRIAAGALGNGVPQQDLRLSQQHRVLVQGAIAKRMFGEPEVLVPARALLGLPGVTQETPDCDVTYFHVLLSRHEILIAEAVLTESLYLGVQAITSIPGPALGALQDILGKPIRTMMRNALGPAAAARKLVQGPRAKRLIARHIRNARPLTQIDLLTVG